MPHPTPTIRLWLLPGVSTRMSKTSIVSVYTCTDGFAHVITTHTKNRPPDVVIGAHAHDLRMFTARFCRPEPRTP